MGGGCGELNLGGEGKSETLVHIDDCRFRMVKSSTSDSADVQLKRIAEDCFAQGARWLLDAEDLIETDYRDFKLRAGDHEH